MKIRRRHLIIVLALALSSVAFAPGPLNPPILGFTQETAAQQFSLPGR